MMVKISLHMKWIITLFTSGVVYFMICFIVESKRSVWDISHMQNRLLAEGKLMYFQMTISRKLVFKRVAGQGRELKF